MKENRISHDTCEENVSKIGPYVIIVYNKTIIALDFDQYETMKQSLQY